MEKIVEDIKKSIEAAIENPKEAREKRRKKLGITSLLGIGKVFDFIKAYNDKDPNISDEEWIKQQYSKPEYADNWKDGDKDPATVAKEIVRGVGNYENAKKGLETHLKLGGTRQGWLAEQIEIGAEINGKDVDEYANEISKGLGEAIQEKMEDK